MNISYLDLRERCGVEPEVVRLWVRKGYVQGDEQGVELRTLEQFLSDIGPYALGWMPTGRALTVGYRAYMALWPQVVGERLALLMSRLEGGASLEALANEQGISVSSLQYQLRKATRQLKDFFTELPNRLSAGDRATPSEGATAVAIPQAELEDSVGVRLRSPLAAWGLSAKCVHALERAGISSLGDLLLVNQACGRSGMLRKVAHFGKGAYDEVERLLLREGLITDSDGEFWQVKDLTWIDKQAPLFQRFRSQKSDNADNEQHNWVREALILRSKIGR